MNLIEKSELNKPQVQLTSGNSWRKARNNYLVYLQSLMERMLRICEAVIVAKVSHFDESKI